MPSKQGAEQGDRSDHGTGNKHELGRRHGHDHGEHDHAGHDHTRHDHTGHDHTGHDHTGHDHTGHGNGGQRHSDRDKHDHDHGGHHHGLGHSHAPASFGRAFAIGTGLNLGFVVVEVVYGILSHSVALLADAGHNLSDVLGLIMAWAAMVLSKRRPSARFTYGLRSSSIFAALFNALFLLVAIGGIAWEAVRRLSDPPAVAGVVAALGVAINAATAAMFMRGRKGDLNIRGAYLHMVADAAISAGVVVSGAVILATGWNWIDPAVSLVVSAIIILGTWNLLHESVRMTFAAVPANIDPDDVRGFLSKQPGVAAVHDLHIWSISTTEIALTAHLVMPGGHPGDHVLEAISEELQHDYGIGHATLQIETSGAQCRLAPDHVV